MAHNSVSDIKYRYSEKKESAAVWRPTEKVVPKMCLDVQKGKESRKSISPPMLCGGAQSMETPGPEVKQSMLVALLSKTSKALNNFLSLSFLFRK